MAEGDRLDGLEVTPGAAYGDSEGLMVIPLDVSLDGTIVHVDPSPDIIFHAGDQEMLRITPDGFYIQGRPVEIKDPVEHDKVVYQGFIKFMNQAAPPEQRCHVHGRLITTRRNT